MKTQLLRYRLWSAGQRFLTKTSNLFFSLAERCHRRATRANLDLLAKGRRA